MSKAGVVVFRGVRWPAGAGKLRALLAGVTALGLGLACHSSAPAAGPLPRHAGATGVRRDALGDPLPAGAVLRLGSVRLRHGGQLFSAVFSPDGKRLASGGWDRLIRLWDPKTGKELRAITGPVGGVRGIAFSPGGKLLAGAGLDGVVYLWDATTGKEVRRLGKGTAVVAVAFSPKGDVLAARTVAGVRLWGVKGGKELRSLEFGRTLENGLAFSPDGRAVAAAGGRTGPRVWAVPSGKLLYELGGRGGRIAGIAFSPDGKALVTAGDAGTLVWDAATGKKVGALGGAGARGTVVAFSPGGTLLALGGEDGAVRLWDWSAGKEVRRVRRHPDWVRSLSFSPDGKVLASVSDGGVIHLWDTATGAPVGGLPGHRERLTSVAYSRDGRVIATAGWDGTVRLWDARTGKETRRLEVADEKRPVPFINPAALRGLALSPDGKLVAGVRGGEVALAWDTSTGKEVRSFRACSVAFSPDGKLLACGGRGTAGAELNWGLVRLYDRATGKLVRELRGHLTQIAALKFSADGKTLMSAGMVLEGARTGEPGESETTFTRFWDVAPGKERPAGPRLAGVQGKALSPDGRTVASADRSGKTITLWEVATGGRRAELAAHTDTIFDVAFSPDCRLLASAGMDGTVRLWGLPSGKEVGQLEGHRGWVLSVAFSPDGKRLVSGGMDTTALVWDVSRFRRKAGGDARPSARELESWWKDLAGDAQAGYRAVGRIASSPDHAVSFLRERLRPVKAPDAKDVERLLADLGSERFETRERATRELARLGELAGPALRKALAGKPPPEVRRRLKRLLARLEGGRLTGEGVRQVRAVEALELIATPEARRLLEGLAGGAPGARLTREAKEALARLKAR